MIFSKEADDQQIKKNLNITNHQGNTTKATTNQNVTGAGAINMPPY